MWVWPCLLEVGVTMLYLRTYSKGLGHSSSQGHQTIQVDRGDDIIIVTEVYRLGTINEVLAYHMMT